MQLCRYPEELTRLTNFLLPRIHRRLIWQDGRILCLTLDKMKDVSLRGFICMNYK